MRYGIVSDVHANLDALEAVFKHAGELDGWICLGDTVGYGPQPNECVEQIAESCRIALIGNHDLAAIEQLDISWFNPYARAAAEWTQQALTPRSREFLEGLPETQASPEWDLIFAHGSLTDPPRDYITNRFEARENFRLLENQVLFIGHSHLSHYFSRREAGGSCDEDLFLGGGVVDLRPAYRYIINCGSVGQPRDRDPRAAYGTLDLDLRQVRVFRVEYDIAAVQRKMDEAGLPPMLAQRLEFGI